MTPEEILKDCWENFYGKERRYNESAFKNSFSELAKDAMAIYAEQEAIAFLNWREGSGWFMSFAGTYYMPLNLREPNRTTQELYQLYKQSKQ